MAIVISGSGYAAAPAFSDVAKLNKFEI